MLISNWAVTKCGGSLKALDVKNELLELERQGGTFFKADQKMDGIYCKRKIEQRIRIGPLHDPVTWYRFNMLVSKLHNGTSKAMQIVPVHLDRVVLEVPLHNLRAII